MDDLPSPLWTYLTSDNRLTGTWRSALPRHRDVPSPCRGACPVDGHIAEWIGQIRDGDMHKAWLTLVANNPFPAVIGRVCHHPCQSVCNRSELDETVSIRSLERHVGDHAIAQGWRLPAPGPATGRKVAIVGGGPAGLSAAWQLMRRGHAVTLFEASDAPGGLLRSGIPSYRLDKAVLDAEIARITQYGLDLRCGERISGRAGLEKLRKDFDAVYLATGASRPRHLPGLAPDSALARDGLAMDGAEFLRQTNAGETPPLGRHVVVIGGGSAAMDVARSARRLGHDVTILALEAEETLPAQRDEVIEAREEGISLVTGARVRAIEPAVTPRVAGLTLVCEKVRFIPGARRGEFTVEALADSAFDIDADAIVTAIGQDADPGIWDGLITADGALASTGDSWQTDLPGVFAGGDLASMDRFVSAAIGMGKEAAEAIDTYLNKAADHEAVNAPEVRFDEINTAYHPPAPRQIQENRPVEERLDSFIEVQLPLAAEQALAEAERCFSCGTCIYCDNCYVYCPDMAVIRLERGYEIRTDYCKGCGLCVAECPTGAVRMMAEVQ